MKKSITEYSNMEVLIVGIITSAQQHSACVDDVLTQFIINGLASISGGIAGVGAKEAEESIDTAILKAQKTITSVRDRTRITITNED